MSFIRLDTRLSNPGPTACCSAFGNKKSGWRCGCQPLVWIRLRRVWAGTRLKPVLLGREGAAAAAIACGIMILKHESLAHQRLFVLERRAVQIQQAFRVDEDTRTVLLEDLVAVAGLGVQAHGV